MKGNVKNRAFATRVVHAGQPPDPATGAVTVPIYQTSTYVFDALGEHRGYDYARAGNPTRGALETNLASLEEGVSGHAFASGMAAISAILTLVGADEHLVASRNVYGGTYRLLTQVLDRYRIEVSWVDSYDLDAVAAAMTDRTRLVFIESPTNPLMEVTDIAAVCEIASRWGAKVAVDNTFLSPYLQQPLTLGADLVVHSTTKFLNGHSDSIGGVVVAAKSEDGEWMEFVQKSVGAILSPFDCFLTLRGIKTLAVRMDRHESNAKAVAEFLQTHPKVSKVYYPGLAGAHGHELQKRQGRGFGAMIAFEVGDYSEAKRLLDGLEVLALAESLGGVETLISHPDSMTHASIPAAERAERGIGPGLIRISVGIEDIRDLLSDLEAALSLV